MNEILSETYTCPYCGGEFSKRSLVHFKKCAGRYLPLLSNEQIEDWKNKYLIDEYSMVDMVKYTGLSYHELQDLFKIIGIPIRGIKDASSSKRKREKYEKTCLEHFGCKHNFCKESDSRKKWEAEMLKKEGIVNVFQRKEVIDKIKNTMIERYGEDWTYQRSKSSDVNYYVEKYGEEEGRKKYAEVCFEKGKSMRKEYYVELYGNEWEKEWKKKIEQRNKGFQHNDGLNKKCQQILEKNDIKYDKEFIILKEKQYYVYDFKIGDNLLLELNGVYWHCSPKIYKENDLVRFPNNHFILAKDKWEYDAKKCDYAKNKGYIVETIWEDEFCEGKVLEIIKKHNYGITEDKENNEN